MIISSITLQTSVNITAERSSTLNQDEYVRLLSFKNQEKAFI